MREPQKHLWFVLITLAIIVNQGCEFVLKNLDLDILIDSSLSFREYSHFLWEKVVELVKNWSSHCKEGDRLGIYGFQTKEKGKVLVEIYSLTVPELEFPAYRHHHQLGEKIGTELKKKLTNFFNSKEPIYHSPILEAIDRIASYHERKSKPWRLVIFSDLLQTSSDLTLSKDYLDRHDQLAIRKKMLSLFPPPSNPPIEIAVFWKEGLVKPKTKREAKTATQRKIRVIFEEFFQAWAPKASLIIQYF